MTDNTRNPEPKEIIGSKDLRESFKEAPRIRGSFFINGVEIHQMDANSPASVVTQINAKTGNHFVAAEIDDGGHLVLIDHSGADILVRLGEPYVEAPIVTGDATTDALRVMRREQDKDQKRDDANHVLELLGLEAASDASAEVSPRPGFETGRSAEERAEARRIARGEAPKIVRVA